MNSPPHSPQKPKNIPTLRFPEFKDAGEWVEKTISDLCRVTQGGTPDTTNRSFWGGSVQWITPAEMGKTESKYISQTVRSLTGDGLKNCSSEVLPLDSIIISTRAPIGHLVINKAPMAINQGCRGLIPKSKNNTIFIYYLLEVAKGKLNDLGSGNTFKELSGATLKKFNVIVPNFLEQQKIADCFSSLDNRITAEAQKLEALKAHKKGLMQQLFPTAGQTTPTLRFPEFMDAGEWVESSLKQICEINPPTNPLPDRFVYIDLESVESGKLIFRKKINKVDAPSRAQRVIRNGDIIYQVVRPYQMNNLFCEFEENENYVASTGYAQLRAMGSNGFLYQLLHTESFVSSVINKCTGSNYPAINSSDLSEIAIFHPLLKEQQKIADCLSSLDGLITAQARKLELLKTHKKGLMQQIFPKITEDTV